MLLLNAGPDCVLPNIRFSPAGTFATDASGWSNVSTVAIASILDRDRGGDVDYLVQESSNPQAADTLASGLDSDRCEDVELGAKFCGLANRIFRLPVLLLATLAVRQIEL